VLPEDVEQCTCGTAYTGLSCEVSQLANLFHLDFYRHMLVWKGIGAYHLLFFLRLVTDISATVAPIGVKFCMMVDIGPGQIFSTFGGVVVRGSTKSEIFRLSFGRLTANVSKTVSRSVTRQTKLNISLTRAV